LFCFIVSLFERKEFEKKKVKILDSPDFYNDKSISSVYELIKIKNILGKTAHGRKGQYSKTVFEE